MRTQNPLFSSWTAYWTDVSERMLRICSAGYRSATPGAAFGAALDAWANVTLDSWRALRAGAPPPPSVIFAVASNEDSATRCVEVCVPSSEKGDPQFVFTKWPLPPRSTGAQGGDLTRSNWRVELDARRTHLKIGLMHLKQPLAPATYEVVVYLGEQVLAIAYVNVGS